MSPLASEESGRPLTLKLTGLPTFTEDAEPTTVKIVGAGPAGSDVAPVTPEPGE